MAQDCLLRLENLSVSFPAADGTRQAVRNLDLELPKAAISCLVGESGCGKSLTCKAVLRLTPENAIIGGKILFNGQNILEMPAKKLRKIRGGHIGMIFQEPMTSLNPVLTVGSQVAETLRLHLGMNKKTARQKTVELFASVGISSAETRYSDYPHQLSGGMRQRIMIAMALSCQPELLLADEPTTALDATIQRQILRLLLDQSRERNMAVLLITHDLGVVASIADYVGVMYAGLLVEYAQAAELFNNPLHPYTCGLMASAPDIDSMRLRRLSAIPGAVPTLAQMPPGCPFQPRCKMALPICASSLPPATTRQGHKTACWLLAS